jgi:hypothetical protein
MIEEMTSKGHQAKTTRNPNWLDKHKSLLIFKERKIKQFDKDTMTKYFLYLNGQTYPQETLLAIKPIEQLMAKLGSYFGIKAAHKRKIKLAQKLYKNDGHIDQFLRDILLSYLEAKKENKI